MNANAEELLAPLPAQTDDDNSWVDGWCWLWYGWRYTRVLWIGAVGTFGAHAPLFACGDCLNRLHAMVWDYAEAQHELPTDACGRVVPLYRRSADGREGRSGAVRYRRGGRHRRARSPLGERFLRAVTEGATTDV
ncbi:hypothetical protein SAMN06297387_119125 [Streptomyces zhaozhouensis]|uniref:Uncharacterized protein n=1 Tax=Streptomyces zhaozhouensis TaxID=1300267 RepID=A0A286E1V8_9ACTN|nr:hypothetical protein [Streptomyces zhaozhouensis]SOD64874.1 hypothetical protein SAMN06297387_119125 [Streptomyces zhaozhouensis]